MPGETSKSKPGHSATLGLLAIARPRHPLLWLEQAPRDAAAVVGPVAELDEPVHLVLDVERSGLGPSHLPAPDISANSSDVLNPYLFFASERVMNLPSATNPASSFFSVCAAMATLAAAGSLMPSAIVL